MTQIAILIPGIMGSELRLDGEVIWPGPFRSLIFSYNLMSQLLHPDLEATDIIRSYSISKQYAALVTDLNACGFREEGSPPSLFVYPYDWRKSVASAAQGLAKLVVRIAGLYQNEEISITLIGHSMGGLVSRYYLESGEYRDNPAFLKVRNLITLGTPHRGAPKALTAALGLEKPLFLSAAQARELSNDPRYPGLYHLLPPPGEPFAWNRAREAAFTEIDIYNADVADALGLLRENLEAAQAFHANLNPLNRPLNVRYFFFVGTSHKTITHVALTRDGAASYRVQKFETEDGGDGTVPVWSANLTGTQNLAVGGEHGTIYRNGDLRRTLATLLGKAGVLAVEPDRVEVAVRDRVVNPNTDVHATLTFSVGTDNVNGELRIELAGITNDGNLMDFTQVSSYLIRYSGLTAEKFSVVLQSPSQPGVYRVAYYPDYASDPAGEDELFVQN